MTSSASSEIEQPHIIFSGGGGEDYTLNEFIALYSADFLDIIYQHNVLPPDSPIKAIRVGIPHLYLFIFL